MINRVPLSSSISSWLMGICVHREVNKLGIISCGAIASEVRRHTRMKVAGKVAIVTGGCQGIGKGIVYALLRKSAKVVFVDINESKGKSLEGSLQQEFGTGSAVFKKCDVTDKSGLRETFHNVKKEFNGLDILVNNAGIISPDNWEKEVAINLGSVIHGTMLGVELMDKTSGNNGGSIINMGSASGFYPISEGAVYSATKAGVINYTRALKPLVKTAGVQVNCICPIFVESTDMVEMGRRMSPDINKVIEHGGTVTVEMVSAAVLKTIEDDKMAGGVVVVSRSFPQGSVYEFPKFKL